MRTCQSTRNSILCGDLNAKEIQKRLRIADSLCCTAETHNIVKQQNTDKEK